MKMRSANFRRIRQAGFGLVELMVGVTVGLIVTAGATVMAVNQINEHRRLMVETQIQQDLRSAADLIIQETRRAGFRYGAEQGAWAPGDVDAGTSAKDATASAHAPISQPDIDGADETLTYQYAIFDTDIDRAKSAAENTVASRNEYGIKRQDGTMYIQIGSENWQPVTDPGILKITKLPMTLVSQKISLEDFCDRPCATGEDCPYQEVRRIDFKIEASATNLPDVKRTILGSERVRADLIQGRCPS